MPDSLAASPRATHLLSSIPAKRVALAAAVIAATALAGWGLASAVDPAALQAAFAGVRWEWVALAGVAYALSQSASAFVWRVGLSAGGLGGVGPGHVLSSHWIGRGAAELLPAQLGEGVRLAAMRRHPETTHEGGCARIAGSLGAFKLVDGLGNFALVGLLTLVIPLPGPAAHLRWIAAAALGVAVVGGLVLWRLRARGAALRLPGAAGRALNNAARGAAMLGDRRQTLGAFGLHFVAAAGRIISLAALLLAFGMPASAALLAYALLVVSALLPISPGGIGVREAALVPALVAAYGLGTDLAIAYSLSIQATVLAVSLVGALIAVAYHELAMPPARPAAAAV